MHVKTFLACKLGNIYLIRFRFLLKVMSYFHFFGEGLLVCQKKHKTENFDSLSICLNFSTLLSLQYSGRCVIAR